VWFWDSSALVSVLADERSSSYFRQLLSREPGVVVWYLTETEIRAAISRKRRMGEIDAHAASEAVDRLRRLAGWWVCVDQFDAVRETANRIVEAYAVTSADGVQLAAALVHVKGYSRGHTFVVVDDGLEVAARAEGFDVVGPPIRGRGKRKRK
jgi:predicted nucleic acid-binding protein